MDLQGIAIFPHDKSLPRSGRARPASKAAEHNSLAQNWWFHQIRPKVSVGGKHWETFLLIQSNQLGQQQQCRWQPGIFTLDPIEVSGKVQFSMININSDNVRLSSSQRPSLSFHRASFLLRHPDPLKSPRVLRSHLSSPSFPATHCLGERHHLDWLRN